MTQPSLAQLRLLRDMERGLRLIGHIRWRTGGKRNWRLFEVRPMKVPTRDRSEVWDHMSDIPEATVLACEKHGWLEKTPSHGTSTKEMRLTALGREVLQGATP